MLGLGAELAQEVLQVLPADPYAQIELANKIVNFAYAQKVAQVESESQQLREAVISKQGTIKSLERRVTNLETEVHELQAKNKAAVEDQHKLQSEKGALIETVKKLNREIAKLEAFKKSLIQHLQEEEDEPSQMARSLAAVDLNSERLVADVLNSATKQATSHAAAPIAPGYGTKAGTSPAMAGNNTRPSYGSGSPRHYQSQPPSSGQYQPAPSQPAQAQYKQDQQQGYSNAGGSAGGSPAAPAVDGKEFFRQARARLSYEQFSQFLNAIKDLNAGRHNREETLQFVRELCGAAHADLYLLFEQLLSRHMTGF